MASRRDPVGLLPGSVVASQRAVTRLIVFCAFAAGSFSYLLLFLRTSLGGLEGRIEVVLSLGLTLQNSIR